MKRIAAYCRVSTDKEDQANSFAAQCRYFREYILRNPQWELHEIYADEGISGTSTKKRIRFNQMIDDAYENRFDLILTKEVSRFSRNILDTIRYTRELKALGIGVVFVSDGINTLDPDAELRLSIMGSIAQEESRKTSTRVKWGQTRQMERGVVFGRSMLGYDVSGGKMTVEAQGAQIVNRIFEAYAYEDKGVRQIARELEQEGLVTIAGNTKWNPSYIVKILKNEKYVGDLVQKKTITPDYLTHAKKYNHGEEPFIRIQNHHESIISRELWDRTQQKLSSRNRCGGVKGGSARYAFSGRIQCGVCGKAFTSHTRKRKNGGVYRYWTCSGGCGIAKQISEDLAVQMIRTVMESAPVDSFNLSEKLIKILEKTRQTADPVILREEKLQDLLLCRLGSEPMIRGILEGMTVYSNGAVDVTLKNLNWVWHFQMIS